MNDLHVYCLVSEGIILIDLITFETTNGFFRFQHLKLVMHKRDALNYTIVCGDTDIHTGSL